MAAPHHRWPPGFRSAVFQRDGKCMVQWDEHCTGKAEEVDHIVSPLDGAPAFDLQLVRASCKSCNVKRENARRKAERLAKATPHRGVGAPSRDW